VPASAPALVVQQPAEQPTAAPQTTPTPYVRPRTVGPRTDSNTTAAPAETPRETQGTQAGGAAESKEAQAAGTPEEIDEDEVVRVDSNLVVIPTSVTDARGRAVTDLRIEDFELRVDGEVQNISDLSRAETPVFITMLFDNSSSLSAAREFEKQAAIRFFRSIIRPIDRAAIYSISTTPTLAQPLTADVNRLVNTIERFGKPDGATALFDTIAQSADYMRPVAGRKVLVLVSDGTDTVSDVPFEEAITRALRAECQIYVVQTRQVEEPNLRDPVSEQRMLKLSEQTGGAVFIPQSIEELDAVFAQIALDLSQQYLLSYYPQQGRKDNYFRFINVSVKSRPNLRVRARKGFYPLAANLNAPAPDVPVTVASADALRASNAKPLAARTSAPRSGRPADSPSGESALSAKSRNNARIETLARRTGPAGPDEEEFTPRGAAPESETTTTTLTIKVADAPPRTPAGADNTPPRAPEPAYVPHTQPTPLPSATPTAQPATAATSTASEATAQPEPAPETTTPTPVTTPTPAPTPAPQTEDNSKPRQESTDAAQKTVSGGVLNARAINLPRPSYPAVARSAGVYGIVVVAVTVDERGRVLEAKAVSGPPLLHGAAVTAARQARFSPFMLSGAAVRVTGTISYNFVRP
jgi:VWFA-related protein/TonB family protein